MYKQGLCLLLCLALLLTLPVAACAEDVYDGALFIDEIFIEHREAVEAMVRAGVMEGFPDGSFQPTSILTRAQACAILVRLVGASPGEETPFVDVSETHWARGYIATCQKAGYISGYTADTFGPSDALTGLAWAKMLLVAIVHYDAEASGMIGPNWKEGVRTLAQAHGLYDSLTEFDPTAPLMRDSACQMAYRCMHSVGREILAHTDGYNVSIIGDSLSAMAVNTSKSEVGVDTEIVGPLTARLPKAQVVAKENKQFFGSTPANPSGMDILRDVQKYFPDGLREIVVYALGTNGHGEIPRNEEQVQAVVDLLREQGDYKLVFVTNYNHKKPEEFEASNAAMRAVSEACAGVYLADFAAAAASCDPESLSFDYTGLHPLDDATWQVFVDTLADAVDRAHTDLN